MELLGRAVLSLVLGLAILLAGCSAAEPADEAGVPLNKELRDELVGMLEEDQAARASGSMTGDRARTERLKEIIAEHGWPTWDLVGRKGETAAWAIAQHSDLDLEYPVRTGRPGPGDADPGGARGGGATSRRGS